MLVFSILMPSRYLKALVWKSICSPECSCVAKGGVFPHQQISWFGD